MQINHYTLPRQITTYLDRFNIIQDILENVTKFDKVSMTLITNFLPREYSLVAQKTKKTS